MKMNRTTIRRLGSAILAGLSLCMILPGCGDTTDPGPDSLPGTQPGSDPASLPGTDPAAEPLPLSYSVGGVPLEEFVIVYNKPAEAEEGSDMADLLQSTVEKVCGLKLEIVPDMPRGKAQEHEIVVGEPIDRTVARDLSREMKDPLDYELLAAGGKLYVAGGGTFGLRAAILRLGEEVLPMGAIPDGFSVTGNAYGTELFPLTEGASLRLMSNNTWNCDANKWQSLGKDCSAEARYQGLCAVYLAARPDVICFQEMTAVMIRLIQTELNKNGMQYDLLTYTTGDVKPYTCILYRADRLSLLEQGHHDFSYGNDANSKGYTWGYFEIKENGRRFVALSTHLWWKSESAQAGSDQWRADQAAEIVAETKKLETRLGCPIFAMGDFNCTTDSKAYGNFISGGFSDTFDLATVFADNNRGYHSCSATGYARETSAQPYKGKAIDHIMLRNPCGSEVLIFDHVRPYFYIRLSDHYPVYTDVRIGC